MALGTDGFITVVGDYDAPGGAPVSGKVTITPSVEAKKGTITYSALPYVVPLDAEGRFSVKLLATDDPDVTPTGFTYQFSVAVTATLNGRVFTDNSSTNFPLPVASANADGIAQINDLVPAPAVGTPSVFLTKNVADERYLLKEDVPELPVDLVTTDDLTAAIAAIPTLDQASLLKVQAGTPDAMVTGAITRDANNAATGFDVLWPDGATGRFTGTPSTSFPGAVDAYTITHVLAGVTSTYTQAAVTRNAAGAVTARPAITVTGGLPPVTPVIPVAPTLSVTSKTDTQVVLAGTGGSNVASLVVKRGTTTIGTALPVTDTGLSASTAYTYTVTATSSTGDTATSTLTVTTSAAPDTTAPTAPTSVTATAGDASAQVTFSGASDNVAVTGYRVYTAASGGSPVASGTSSPITVSGLTNGTAYTLYVSALDAAGNESTRAASNSVTPAAAVTVPTGTPTVTRGTSTVTTQPLTWTAVSGATAYDVEHKASSGSTWTVDTTSVTGTSYTVTGLTASTSYDYRVRARNSAGPAASYSAVVTGSTAASGGGTPAPGTIVLADNFTGADADTLTGRTLPDGTDTTKTWSMATDSTIGIRSNAARAVLGPTGGGAFAVADSGLTAVKVGATFPTLLTPTTNRKVGLLFRFQDSANYWRVDPNGGTWLVRKIVGGSASTVITGGTAAAGDVVTISAAADNTITLTVNGTATTATDAALATATKVGLYGQATTGASGATVLDQTSTIDGFAVTAL